MERILAKIEYWVFLCIKILLFIIVSTQVLLLIPGMGGKLCLALYLEGERLNDHELFRSESYLAGNISPTPWTSITLELQEYQSRPDVIVEINGIKTGSFLRKEITLNIRENDVITYYNPDKQRPVKIKVSKTTPNIMRPELGVVVNGTGRRYFAPIRLK